MEMLTDPSLEPVLGALFPVDSARLFLSFVYASCIDMSLLGLLLSLIYPEAPLLALPTDLEPELILSFYRTILCFDTILFQAFFSTRIPSGNSLMFTLVASSPTLRYNVTLQTWSLRWLSRMSILPSFHRPYFFISFSGSTHSRVDLLSVWRNSFQPTAGTGTLGSSQYFLSPTFLRKKTSLSTISGTI